MFANVRRNDLMKLMVALIMIMGIVPMVHLWAILVVPIMCFGLMIKGGKEFLDIVSNNTTPGFNPPSIERIMFWIMGGSLSVMILCLSAGNQGNAVVFLLASVTLGCDFSANFFGKLFGKKFIRHAPAPVLSPNKSWEGNIGGVLATIPLSLMVGQIYHLQLEWWVYVFVAPIFGSLAVAGDLFGSRIKRTYGVKDFGGLIPHHGGVLDRFDAVLYVAPYFLMAVLIHKITTG